MNYRIEYQKARWVKYNGRLLPRYEEQSWVVWVEVGRGIQFNDFEKANIFAELLELKEQVNLLIKKENERK